MSTFTLSPHAADAALEFPAAEVAFAKDGTATSSNDIASAKEQFAAAGITDLIVMCGGWADDPDDARNLFEAFTITMRDVIRRDRVYSAHIFGVLRAVWPTHRWLPDAPDFSAQKLSDEDLRQRNIAALEMQITGLRGTFSGKQADRHLLKVWQLVSAVNDSVPAQVSLVEHVRELVRGADDFNHSLDPDEYASRRFLAMHPLRLLEALAGKSPAESTQPMTEANVDDSVSFAPDESARCDVYEGIRNLLRFATAHELRIRSEAVGRMGLYENLLLLGNGLRQTRLHFVGHSYGARVLLSAANGPRPNAPLIRPKTITVLQGALAEDTFAPARGDKKEGKFHSVLAEGKVGGPILVTHSSRDEIAGVPYAIAARIAAHTQPGDRLYPHLGGAIAQHGATGLETAQASLSSHIRPGWRRGQVVNLNAYDVVKSHDDVCKPQVVDAVISAATTTT